jgi:hypothetical protein
MMIDARVQALCDEFGIEIIPSHCYPDIGQTRAPWHIQRIIERFGMDHARAVMRTLAETANNKALLDESGLWAASDLLRAYARIYQDRPTDWFEVWDAAPVGELQFVAQQLRGFVKIRPALAGMVQERLYKRFGKWADQPDLLDDRRTA